MDFLHLYSVNPTIWSFHFRLKSFKLIILPDSSLSHLALLSVMWLSLTNLKKKTHYLLKGNKFSNNGHCFGYITRPRNLSLSLQSSSLQPSLNSYYGQSIVLSPQLYYYTKLHPYIYLYASPFCTYISFFLCILIQPIKLFYRWKNMDIREILSSNNVKSRGNTWTEHILHPHL